MPEILEPLLAELEAGEGQRRIAGAFAVVPIPGYPRQYFGVDEQGSPCVLLHAIESGGRVVPALRLRGLVVQYAVPCRVALADGTTREENLTTIVCLAAGTTERRYFLHAAEIVLRIVGAEPDLAAVIAGTQRLADIFQRLALPARRPLTGLLGELIVILESRSAHDTIAAWRSGADDTFDFSAEDVRLEVKAAHDRLRAHFLTYEQSHPPAGTFGILASVFIESSGGGMSLEELIRAIEARLRGHNDAMLHLHQVIATTLGISLTAALGERFDRQLAVESLQFFDLADVPAIRGTLPDGVSKVRFRTDLSLIASRPLRTFNRWRAQQRRCFRIAWWRHSRKERPQAREQGVVPRFAFPYHEDIPSQRLDRSEPLGVTRLVAAQLRKPVFGAGPWLACEAAAGMLVPETSVNEDHLSQPRED